MAKVNTLLFPGLLFMGFLLPFAIWVGEDQAVWPWDPAWYGQVTLELNQALRQDFILWLKESFSAFGFKAPGIAWIGQFFVPLRAVLGTEGALLLSVALYQVMTLTLIFKLTAITAGRLLPALFGWALAASAPLFVGLSHSYFVEPLQTFSITWIIWIAATAEHSDRRWTFFMLLIASSLAMAAKITSPLYAFLPGLYAFRGALNSKERTAFSTRHIVCVVGGAVFGASITAAWYFKNWSAIADFTRLASSGEAASYYGSKGTLLEKLWFWTRAFGDAFWFPVPGLWLFGVGLATATVSRFQACRPFAREDWLAMISAVQISLVLLILSSQTNEESRYLLPLLPYVAILISWALRQLPWRPILILCGVWAIGQTMLVHGRAFGLIATELRTSIWLTVPERDSAPRLRLSEVVRRTCTPESRGRYNAIGVELRSFNANSAAFFSAIQTALPTDRCYYLSLGHAETDEQGAWARLLALRIAWYVTLTNSLRSKLESKLEAPFNHITNAVAERVRDSSYFVPFAECPPEVLCFAAKDARP